MATSRVVGTMAEVEAIAAVIVDQETALKNAQRVADHATQKAEAMELELERIRAHLPGFIKFCEDLARTSINPIAKRARTQANTLALLLPPSENDEDGQ